MTEWANQYAEIWSGWQGEPRLFHHVDPHKAGGWAHCNRVKRLNMDTLRDSPPDDGSYCYVCEKMQRDWSKGRL